MRTLILATKIESVVNPSLVKATLVTSPNLMNRTSVESSDMKVREEEVLP